MARSSGARRLWRTAALDDLAFRHEVESLLAQERTASPLDKPVWVPENLLVQPPRSQPGTWSVRTASRGFLASAAWGRCTGPRITKLGRNVALKVLPEIFATVPSGARVSARSTGSRRPESSQHRRHPWLGRHWPRSRARPGAGRRPTLADRIGQRALPPHEDDRDSRVQIAMRSKPHTITASCIATSSRQI